MPTQTHNQTNHSFSTSLTDIRVVKESSQATEHWLQAAEEALAGGNYKAAEDDFLHALDKEPENPHILIQLGQVYAAQGNQEQALAMYQRASEVDPTNADAYNSMGVLYENQKEYQKALAAYQKVVELAPNNPTGYLNCGDAFMALQQFEDALKAYASATERMPTPDSSLGYWKQGAAHAAQGNQEQALVMYQRAIETDPNNADAYNSRGLVYADQEAYTAAIAEFSEVIKLIPEMPNGYNARAQIYLDQMQYQSAQEDYRKAVGLAHKLEDVGQEETALSGLAWSLYRVDQYEELLPIMNNLLKLTPQNAWALGLKADINKNLGNYQEALADLNRAIELAPKKPELYCSRAWIYYTELWLEHCPEALADYDHALELEPNNAQNLAARGRYFYDLKQYDKALADLDRAIELESDNAYAIAYKGRVLCRQGYYEQALSYFNRALKLSPGDDWCLYGRALIYLRLQEQTKAKADLSEAIKGARHVYEKHPQDWRNTFNLSLFLMAATEYQESEKLIREAFNSGTSTYRIREAIHDRHRYLEIFPGHEQAQVQIALLTKYLDNAQA